MVHEFRMSRRMQFAETDMAGIVHFSNFFRFMEETEHAFFRSLDLQIHGTQGESMFGWVRVHTECDYSRPAHYMDELEIHLSVREKTAKSLCYDFVFRIESPGEVQGGSARKGQEIARGKMNVVHVRKAPEDERIRAHDMPSEVADLIDVSPIHST